MRRRIVSARDDYPWLVFANAGHVRGYAYASPHRSRAAYQWAVDVSVYIAPEARRQGIARQLYMELFQTLAAQGYCAAFAGVALPNEPGCRLHVSVGFSTVGVYHAVGFKFNAGVPNSDTFLEETSDVVFLTLRSRPYGSRCS